MMANFWKHVGVAIEGGVDLLQSHPPMKVGQHYYWTDRFGVHHQDGKPEVVYNVKYVRERYDAYGIKTRAMSCLRLGFIASRLPWSQVRTVLDVGYGNGDFLRMVASSGKGAFGTDVSGYPIEDPNVELVPADWLSQDVSLLTMFDVLEHFPDLNFLAKLRAKWVVISAPWCHWQPGEPGFAEWKHRRPGEHLHHFNPKSLRLLMESVGYQKVCRDDDWNIEDGLRGPVVVEGEERENIFTSIFARKDTGV